MLKWSSDTNSLLTEFLILLKPDKSMQRDTGEMKTMKYTMCVIYFLIVFFLTFYFLFFTQFSINLKK